MGNCSVGFIGTGAMGEHMCRNVARSGRYAVRAFDLDAEPLERLAGDGVETAADAADLAGRSDVVILSLPGGPEVERVAEDILLPAARPGWIVIDMSTTPVGLTRTVAARLGERHGRFLDAPVARTQQAAVDGTLSIMVGGDAGDLDRVRDILGCMGSDITHCGGVGAGQIAKILNNMVVFQNGVAIAEALTIGERSGMEPAVLLDVINRSSGASFVGQNHAAKAMVPDRFPLRQFPARYALKDLSYALMLAGDGDVRAPGAELAGRLLQQAIDMGCGDEYWPTIIKAVRSGIK